MEPRRVTDLPANPAALATYGDVVLADHLMQAAWADWRAGRMSLDEALIWQSIHRMTLRGYLRLITGGDTHVIDVPGGRAGGVERDHAGGGGHRGAGTHHSAVVVSDAHTQSIQQPAPSLNTSEGPC